LWDIGIRCLKGVGERPKGLDAYVRSSRVAGVDEELEGEAEKVASDHKDSTGGKSAHSEEFFKNAKWRRRWIIIPLASLTAGIYGFIFAKKLFFWAKNKQFDQQKGLKIIRISAVKERMLYDLKQFEVRAGQPVKLEFVNPDAISHNLVIIRPGTEEAVGLEVNRMIADPKQIEIGQYIPETDAILFHTEMVPPNSGETLRFIAPRKPGNYPYICTFPGHWTIMKGVMVVK
jgi:azurin